jgi:hypothetical protein
LNFYIRSMDRTEKHDLSATAPDDLLDEIDLMRVAIRRIFDLIESEKNLRVVLQALNAVTNACGRMAQVMSTQQSMDARSARTGANINLAVSQALEEITCSLPVPPQLPSGAPSEER